MRAQRPKATALPIPDHQHIIRCNAIRHDTTQVDLARRRAFPAVDVTYQMNLQSPGAALLPEPTRAFVQVSEQ